MGKQIAHILAEETKKLKINPEILAFPRSHTLEVSQAFPTMLPAGDRCVQIHEPM